MHASELKKRQKLENKLKKFLNKYFELKERITAFKKRQLYTLELELTDSCNLQCAYCYASSTQTSRNVLGLEKAKELINDSIECGIKTVWLLGGEPLLKKDIFKIVKYAKDSGIQSVTLFTNGLALGSKTKQVSKYIDTLVFHLDSVDSASFAQTQIKPERKTQEQHLKEAASKHKKIIKSLEKLLAEGFNPKNIRLDLTLSKPVYESLKQTIEWAIKEKNLQTLTLVPLFTAGKALECPKKWRLTKKEMQKAFQLSAEIQKKPELMLLGPTEYCKHYQLTNCYIQANGNVVPYPGQPSAGNIYKTSLKKIIRENYDLLAFRNLVSNNSFTNNLKGACGKCPNQKLCFGNRTMAALDGKGLKGSDPNCWIKGI